MTPPAGSEALVACYAMNDNNATTVVTDSCGFSNGISVAMTSEMYNASGKIDGCLDFNGTSDYIDTNSAFPALWGSNWSISIWFKSSGDGELRTIINSGTGGDQAFALSLSTTQLDLWYQAGEDEWDITDTTLTITDTNWHHVVISYTTSSTVMYVDSTAFTYGDSSSLNSINGNIFIGKDFYGSYWKGSIDNVGFYNYALDQNEVNTLYNSGNGVACCVVAAGEPVAPANNYYVDDVNGNNTNDGNAINKAWKDPNYAIRHVPAGATINLWAGDYNAFYMDKDSNKGNDGNWITIQTDPCCAVHSARINGNIKSPTDTNIGTIVFSSAGATADVNFFIKLHNLEVNSTDCAGNVCINYDELTYSACHIEIEDCNIHGQKGIDGACSAPTGDCDFTHKGGTGGNIYVNCSKYITAKDCNVFWGHIGIQAYYGVNDYLDINGCDVHHHSACGIRIGGNEFTSTDSVVSIQNTKVHDRADDWGTKDGSLDGEHGNGISIHHTTTTGAKLINVVIYNWYMPLQYYPPISGIYPDYINQQIENVLIYMTSDYVTHLQSTMGVSNQGGADFKGLSSGSCIRNCTFEEQISIMFGHNADANLITFCNNFLCAYPKIDLNKQYAPNYDNWDMADIQDFFDHVQEFNNIYTKHTSYSYYLATNNYQTMTTFSAASNSYYLPALDKDANFVAYDVNYTADVYKLKAGSVAINKGSDVNQPATDLLGVTRDATHHSAGAKEP